MWGDTTVKFVVNEAVSWLERDYDDWHYSRGFTDSYGFVWGFLDSKVTGHVITHRSNHGGGGFFDIKNDRNWARPYEYVAKEQDNGNAGPRG